MVFALLFEDGVGRAHSVRPLYQLSVMAGGVCVCVCVSESVRPTQREREGGNHFNNSPFSRVNGMMSLETSSLHV